MRKSSVRGTGIFERGPPDSDGRCADTKGAACAAPSAARREQAGAERGRLGAGGRCADT